MKEEDVDEQSLASCLDSLRERIQNLEEMERQRIQAERDLTVSQQRLHSIIDGTAIPTFVIDREHRILYWNRALEALSAIPGREVLGTRQHWRAFYSSERPCMADLLVDSALEDIPGWYQGKFRKSNLLDEAFEATDFFPELGDEGKWLRFTAAAIRDAAGILVGAIETLEDVTERKMAEEALLKAREELEQRVRERTEALQSELQERQRAEEALKQTTDHLSLILESLPIVPFTCRTEGKFPITFVGSAIKEVTGYEPDRFLNDPSFWFDGIHPDDRRKVLTSQRREIVKGTHHSEYRFRVANGSYRWFSDYRRIVASMSGTETYVVGTWQDVTEEKRLRQESDLRLQQIIQTHKLAALGEVVTGVAHEINNPISFIGYNIPILEEIWQALTPLIAAHVERNPAWTYKGMSPKEISQQMNDIIHAFKTASNRISHVVKGLKEFARTDESVQKIPVQVNDIVRGALTIVGSQLRKNVAQIDLDLAEDLPLVSGHYQKIEQILTNILINAYQAIPSGNKGRVRIMTRHVAWMDCVLLIVEDNGRGMEQDVLSQIFDPFYTTRRDSGGTGLGLSISYSLVQEHHGLIGVLSRPGMGSRFSIFLPVDGLHLPRVVPSVLCIDQDMAFLQQIRAYFIDAEAWHSDDTDSPTRILQYLDAHPEVDMIVAEIVLPSMDGWNLLAAVKEKTPLLPVILCSADIEVLDPGPSVSLKADAILQKPFSMDRLQDTIQQLGRQRL
jgi:PAS domain S-box-containing protein